ncbi:MAG: nucleotidyltransferase domain-containing protein [Patescibacteria group bacterium]
MSKFLNPNLFVLFGSQSKGYSNEVSDFDIGVVMDKPMSLEEKNILSEEIAKEFSFNEDKIDLVDLNEASPLLQMEAAKSGKLLKGSEEDFFKFKLLAWKRYQHTTKFRKMRADNLQKIYG